MLNYKACLVLVLLVVLVFKTNAQSSVSLEKEDNSESAIPVFKDEASGLLAYFRKITTIIATSTKDESNLPTSLKMILTINKAGKVINVDFPNTNMEINCKTQVKNELLKMEGWKAAESNGKPIVSKYHWNISCLLWSQ